MSPSEISEGLMFCKFQALYFAERTFVRMFVFNF